MIARGAALLFLAALGGCASEDERIRERIFANTDYMDRADSLFGCETPEPISHAAWMATHASLHRAIDLLEGGYADAALEEAARGWTLAHEYETLLLKRGCARRRALAEAKAKEPEPVVEPVHDPDLPLTDSAKEAAALAEWLHLLENSPFAAECEARMPAHELEEIEGIHELHLTGPVTPSTIASLEWMQSIYARHQCGRTLIAHWRETTEAR